MSWERYHWIIALKTHFFNISLHLKLIYRAFSLTWPASCQFIGTKDVFHIRKRKGWTPIRGSQRGVGWGGGVVFRRFQVSVMIEWGQKSKPKKSLDQKLTPKTSHAEFPSLNKFGCTLFAELCGRDYVKLVPRALSFQIVLNTPKNPNLNRATQKSNRNQKFQPPKNTPIIRVTWYSEYPRPAPPHPSGLGLRWT